MRWQRTMIVLHLAACGPKPQTQDAAGSTSTGPPATTEATPTTTTPTSTEGSGSSSTGTTEQTTGLATATSTSGSNGFLGPPDLPGEQGACDPHAEMPCPEGQKCSAAAARWIPWLLWTGTPACFPILGDKQKGEPCDLGRAPADGLDDCGAGTICADIFLQWGETGVCVDFCDPPNIDGNVQKCASPTDFCFNPGCQECGLSLCAPACDPLAPACPDGTGCQQWSEAFRCDAIEQDLPAVGQPCDLGYECVPGAACVPSPQVADPSCGDAEVCCTPLCDLNEPNTCPGAAMGETCQPVFPVPFDPVEEPWGVQYNKLGFCTLP